MLRKRISAVILSMALCTSMIAEVSAAAFTSETVATEAADFGDGVFSSEAEVVVPEITETPVVSEVTETPVPTVTPEVAETPEFVVVPEETTTPEFEVVPEVTETPVPTVTPEVTKAPAEDPFASEEINMFQDGASSSSEIEDAVMDDFAGVTIKVKVNESAWKAVEVSGEKKYMLQKSETEYYKAADGVLTVTTVTAFGEKVGRYFFDENGYMITGRKVLKPKTPGYPYETEDEFYFASKEKAKLYSGASGEVTPVNSNLGQMLNNYWLWDGTVFRHYANSGKFISIAEFKEYQKTNNTYKGYFKIDKDYYFLDNNGKPYVGYRRINGKLYYFQTANETKNIPGKMFRKGWRKSTNEKGTKWEYSYWESAGENVGVIQEHNGYRATTVGTGSGKYLLDHNGYIKKNKYAKAIDGYYYLSDKNGRVYTNKLVKHGNYRYYFTGSGRQATWKNCWKRLSGTGKRYYYFGSTAGRVEEKTGWQKIYTTTGSFEGWFYFPSSGNHYVNRWAGKRYFYSTGKMASGLSKVSGQYYFFEVSTESTRKGNKLTSSLFKYNNNWYYAQSNGQLRKSGWQNINGDYYYFNNYKVKKNTFEKLGTKYGYLNSTGKYCTGWVIESNALNKVKYVDSVNGCFYKNTNVMIDGLRYYFDANGYRINDLTNIYTGPYYVRVDKTNGTMTIYDAATRTVPVKSIRVSVGNPISLTPNGTYRLNRAGRWQSLMGPSWGQYGTHVAGAGRGGIFVHSIACSAANSYNLPAAQYNKLGNPASHGCIRCCVADAKWVYDHCNGATINIYQGSYKADEALKGPLGRRKLEPLRAPYNFDPTDPAV